MCFYDLSSKIDMNEMNKHGKDDLVIVIDLNLVIVI